MCSWNLTALALELVEDVDAPLSEALGAFFAGASDSIALGLTEEGFAFALTNLGWSIGQTAGSAASARLADATHDAVPYLTLSGICLLTLLVLARTRRKTTISLT